MLQFYLRGESKAPLTAPQALGSGFCDSSHVCGTDLVYAPLRKASVNSAAMKETGSNGTELRFRW
eukprot:4159511-Pleurochrysis_carterae.AAC.4